MLKILLLCIGLLAPPTHRTPEKYTSTFETAQDRLWKNRVVDAEEDLPTDDEIWKAADQTESDIRLIMREADALRTSYRTVTRRLCGMQHEGCADIHAWYEGNELRIVKFGEGGESWHCDTTFYYTGDRLIARTYTEERGWNFMSRYNKIASRGSEETIFLEAPDLNAIDDEDRVPMELIPLALASPGEEFWVEDRSGRWMEARPTLTQHLRDGIYDLIARGIDALR